MKRITISKILPLTIAIIAVATILICAAQSECYKNEIINFGLFMATTALALTAYIQLKALHEQATFLDPRFAPISAIWAVDLNGASVIGNSEPMVVIHNPFALNPIPVGFLPVDSEYVATPSGEDDFLLEKIESKNISNEYQSTPTDVL